MRQRHEASPVKTIDRPSPKRCTATSARGVPPGPLVTASTLAPGRGPPSGVMAASAGTASHRFRVSSAPRRELHDGMGLALPE